MKNKIRTDILIVTLMDALIDTWSDSLNDQYIY